MDFYSSGIICDTEDSSYRGVEKTRAIFISCFFSLSSYCIFKRNPYNRLLFYAGEKQHTLHHIASTEPFKHFECNTDACF